MTQHEQVKSYQVVIRPDAKQFSEVAEGHRSVCLEAEVREMVRWSEVAAFTKVQRNIRPHQIKRQQSNSFFSQVIIKQVG